MPRTARASVGGLCYHVLNRGNAQRTVFHKDGDYCAFLKAMRHASEQFPQRVLAYCLMPNHFHLVLWPYSDGDLGRWMHWLLNAHVRRYHQHYHSSGHLWQGRFKAFPIEHDDHLLTVLRYVERNALRAGLVTRVEQWPYSSLSSAPGSSGVPLSLGPVARPDDWLAWVNTAQTEVELECLRRSIRRGAPYGSALWTEQTADALGLQASLRPKGRPRKANNDECPL